MEAIVPAFLLGLLSQLGDRPAWLAAILADRYRSPLKVVLMAGLAQAIGNGVAAAASLWIAPHMTPNAQALLLAVALVIGGLSGLLPAKPPARLESWRLGSWLTSLLGMAVLVSGERTPFFTLAIGVQGLPWLAAAGGTLGAFAVTFVAVTLGEKGWVALPQRWLRLGVGGVFVVAGLWIGLGAVRLL